MQQQKRENCSGLFGVVPVLLYVFFYRVGNNVLDRLLVFDEVADVGRRDVQQWRIQLGDVGTQGIFYLEARPVVDNERIVCDQVLVVLPAVNVLKAIGPHYYRKLLEGELFGEVSKCIYGIRRLGQGKLYIACPELGIVFYGYVDQVQAVVLIEQGMRVFEWIVRRYYKPYLVYIGMVDDMIGHYEMAGMYGVEAAEIQSDMHSKRKYKVLGN
jgi:hypothetical protein